MLRSKSSDSLRTMNNSAKPMIKSMSSDVLHKPCAALPDLAMEFQYESMMPSGLIGSACAINSVDKLPYKIDEFPQELLESKNSLGACLACQPDDVVLSCNVEIPPRYIEMFVRIRNKSRKNKYKEKTS